MDNEKEFNVFLIEEDSSVNQLNNGDVVYGDRIERKVSNNINQYAVTPAVNNMLKNNTDYTIIPVIDLGRYDNTIEIKDGNDLLYSAVLTFDVSYGGESE